VAVWEGASSREVPGRIFPRTWPGTRQDFSRPRRRHPQKRNKMVIGIEPSAKQESNIITPTEALRLVREVTNPQIKMIID